MAGKPIREIAAAVVQREQDGKVLLLKRAPAHNPGGGQWCFVTGHIEPDEEPRAASIRELGEELSLHALPVKSGNVVVVETDSMLFQVHPFLFVVPDFPVQLDWEHTEFTWIEPQEVYNFDFVPQLDEDLRSLGLLPSAV